MMATFNRTFNKDNSDYATTVLRDDEEHGGSCESEIANSINTYGAVEHRSWKSLMAYLKMSLESTVCCGMLAGLFGTLLWWLELNLGTYCPTKWENVPQSIHHRRLLVDVFIIGIVQFWVFTCIAPLCRWPTIKKLSMIYICTIGALLNIVNHLIFYVLINYSKKWKECIGSLILLVTSFTVCYRFAQHRKETENAHYNAFVLALKVSLQFTIGILVSVSFNLAFLDFYYNSSPFKRTMLACGLTIACSIPKFFINLVIIRQHRICRPGDEIMFVIAYMTATTVCTRLMQAKIEKLSYFVIISVLHGLLIVFDKLALLLKRKLLSLMCCKCKRKDSHQFRSENISSFLANQTLISTINETTSVIFSSSVAYLVKYYYAREEGTNKRYNGYLLLKEMVIRCSLAIAIELVFNAITVKMQTCLYNLPIISVWKRNWKSIIIVHMIQMFLISLYFSKFIDNVILEEHYIVANVTCFGFFKRV